MRRSHSRMQCAHGRNDRSEFTLRHFSIGRVEAVTFRKYRLIRSFLRSFPNWLPSRAGCGRTLSAKQMSVLDIIGAANKLVRYLGVDCHAAIRRA